VNTQNIDGLQEQCNKIPSDKIIAVHGTISRAVCETCGDEIEFEEFCNDVRRNIKDIYNQDVSAPKESSNIPCKSCSQPTVKPETVLFGGSLPQEFFQRVKEDLPTLDVLIVAGTSLVVSPANSLVYNVPSTTIRFIVNKEQVGEELGIDYSNQAERDFFAKGNCDDIFLELISELGWLSDISQILDQLPESSANLVREKMNQV